MSKTSARTITPQFTASYDHAQAIGKGWAYAPPHLPAIHLKSPLGARFQREAPSLAPTFLAGGPGGSGRNRTANLISSSSTKHGSPSGHSVRVARRSAANSPRGCGWLSLSRQAAGVTRLGSASNSSHSGIVAARPQCAAAEDHAESTAQSTIRARTGFRSTYASALKKWCASTTHG